MKTNARSEPYPGDEKSSFIREVAGSMSRLASTEHALLVAEVTNLGNAFGHYA